MEEIGPAAPTHDEADGPPRSATTRVGSGERGSGGSPEAADLKRHSAAASTGAVSGAGCGHAIPRTAITSASRRRGIGRPAAAKRLLDRL
jgi:hypothetical protein